MRDKHGVFGLPAVPQVIKYLGVALSLATIAVSVRAQPGASPTVHSVAIQPLKGKADRERLWEAIRLNAKAVSLPVAPMQSIEDAIRMKCGNVQPDLVNVFKEMNGPGPYPLVDEGKEYRFIPCPYWFFGNDGKKPKTMVRAGENIKDIASSLMGANGEKTLANLIKLNPEAFDKDGKANSTRSIELPFIAKKMRMELYAGFVDGVKPPPGAQAVIAALPDAARDFTIKSGVTSGPKEYQLVQRRQGDTPEEIAACGWPGGDSPWPIDTLKVGMSVNAARASLHSKPPYGVVLIADTGVQFDNGTKPWRWINKDLANGFASHAFFGNDQHGASMVTGRGEDIDPPAGYEFAMHGTNVFRVITQTQDRLQLKDPEGYVAVAKLNDLSAPYAIDSAAVANAFHYGREILAHVLNLSVVIGKAPNDLIESVENSPFVIVSAAGNDGEWLHKMNLYPPALNTARDRLLVVGAHDWNGRMAPFSNRGEQVDILAPGCAIPLQQGDGSMTFFSGTSIAAPFVSEAVSLLIGVGMPKNNPWRLRNRIIASGKFSSDLVGLTRYAVRLDTERAIRVKEDSILLKDAAEPVYGELEVSQNWTCDVGGTVANWLPHNVAKVIATVAKSGPRITEIWTNSPTGGDLVKHRCDATFENSTFKFKRKGNPDFEEIAWEDTVDVVTRVPAK